VSGSAARAMLKLESVPFCVAQRQSLHGSLTEGAMYYSCTAPLLFGTQLAGWLGVSADLRSAQ
jgi:hypothetical protein